MYSAMPTMAQAAKAKINHSMTRSFQHRGGIARLRCEKNHFALAACGHILSAATLGRD